MLTTGVDTFTGTDKDDTYNADILTLGNSDSLNGGAGTDTLNATINADVAATFAMSNIENFNVTNYGGKTIDFTSISGVTTVAQKDGTGQLTLNNIGSANVNYTLQGTSTNDIVANYKAGVLSGSTDSVTLTLNGASNAALDVDAGVENLKINVGAASSLSTLTVPGVTTATITGSAALTLNTNLATAFETVNATAMTGAIVGKTINATTGLSTEGFTGASNGSSILLGTGNDNIKFTDNTATGKSNTVKLGAGNDTLDMTTAGAGANYIFAEAGDDKVQVNGVDGDDLIDMGAGTDTLIFDGANTAVVVKGAENITVNAGATVAFNSMDQAATVTAKANGGAVDVQGLYAGSTVTVEKATAASTAATGVTVKFNATEAASTININSGMTGELTTDKITAVTANLAVASDITSDYSLTAAQSFTLNATGALSATAGKDVVDSAATDTLKTVTVTGTDLVKMGAVTSTVMETVSLKAAKDLTYGVIGSDSTKLTTVTLEATAGAIAGDAAIGIATNTNVLSVTATAKNAIDLAAINSAKIGNISATSTASAKTIDIGAIGANATEIGNITVAADGDITLAQIGTETATSFGTLTATSTNGKVKLAATGLNVKDANGIDVALSAKTTIDSNGSGTAAVIKNVGGNITATIAGAADAVVNFTATTSGLVNVTATNTGKLVSTVTNAGTAGAGQTSTVNLGNAATGKTNVITLAGTVDNVVVNGGTGNDTVKFDASNVFKTGTFALGVGTNTVDFTNVVTATTDTTPDNGIAINLGSSPLTLDSGQLYASTVAAGKAVAYDFDGDENNASATSTKIVSGGDSYTLSGVTNVVGTAKNDYIVANSTGSTITGGDGVDTIIGGAGNDKITGGAGADNITLGAGKDILVLNDIGLADTVTDYSVADDTIHLSKAVFTALSAATVGDTLAAANFVSLGDATDLAISGTVAGATNTQAFIFLQDTKELYYNADGATAGGLTLVGTFTGDALVAGEFTIIA